MKITKSTLLFSLIAAAATAAHAQTGTESTIDFSNHARVIFSAPVSPQLAKKFGPGWTRLTYQSANGQRIQIMSDEALTSSGGVVFSPTDRSAISPDGQYLALDLTRNGTASTADGNSDVESREFCPVLDTRTGCVVRNDTGAICGGSWDSKGAVWHGTLDSAGPVAESIDKIKKPSAQDVWTQYANSPVKNMPTYLQSALGLDNLKACDPPNAANQHYYAQIEAALGQAGGSTPSGKTTQQTPPADGGQPATVKSERAQLFARPSVGSIHRGYLIRGDHVAIIGTENGGWLQIRYERAGKPPIEAWLQSADISR
jgi:hypothetical protein